MAKTGTPEHQKWIGILTLVRRIISLRIIDSLWHKFEKDMLKNSGVQSAHKKKKEAGPPSDHKLTKE